MRLLVVGDEADLLAGLARALRRAGHAAGTAAEGEQGLHGARATGCGAIVLDVVWARLGGR